MAAKGKDLFDEDIETEDVIYEVEEILAKQEIGGKNLYLIKWKGYNDDWNSWEPESIMNCDEKLAEFEKKLKAQNGESSGSSRRKKSKHKSNGNVMSKKRTSTGKRKSLTVTEDTPSSKKMTKSPSSMRRSSRSRLTRSSASQVTKEEDPVMVDIAWTKNMEKVAVLEFPQDDDEQPARRYVWYNEAVDDYPKAVVKFYEKHLKFEGVEGDALRLVEIN